MTRKSHNLLAGNAMIMAFAIGGLVLAMPISLASAQGAASNEIVITAPRAIKGSSTAEWVAVTVHVDIRDLDLKTAAGSIELEKRVANAASEACGRLDSLYPIGKPDLRGCIEAAVSEAQSQVYFAKAVARE